MAIGFDTHEDTRQRINRTICSYDGKPVFVQVDGVNEISIWPLRRDVGNIPPKKVRVTDKKFSYASAPLGYMNYQKNAFYVMRVPNRQTRAGISSEILSTDPAIPPAEFFMSKAFENCIMGTHPSLPTALKSLSKDHNSVAIHRHLALFKLPSRHIYELRYRGAAIGAFDSNSQQFIFSESPMRSFVERIVQNLHLQEGNIVDEQFAYE